LETDRLVLRGFVDDDLHRFAAIVADAEFMRWLGGRKAARPRALDWMFDAARALTPRACVDRSAAGRGEHDVRPLRGGVRGGEERRESPVARQIALEQGDRVPPRQELLAREFLRREMRIHVGET